MARGPEITDEVKMLIARLHKEHPKWTNIMIRNEVLSIVHKRDSSLPKGWPSKFAVDRIMPGIRKHAKHNERERNPIDQPWTIQSMSNSQYYIPSEALPSVLRVWFHAKEQGYDLSIRHAQWVGRLYAVITDVETLSRESYMASAMESLAEWAGIKDFLGTEAVNLYLFSMMTGHVVTSEEAKSIGGALAPIGPKGENLYLVPWMGTVQADMTEENLDGLRRGYEAAQKMKLRRKGGQNERQHKTQRQE